MMQRHGWAAYLTAALRSPLEVGTVTPSGTALAERLAAVVRRTGRPQVVVEVGAGTGEVTGAIVARAAPGTLVLAVEKDPALADALRARGLDAEVVTADALTLPTLLTERGLTQADVIVSVLPWTLLPAARQAEFLGAFARALHPDGVFTAAAYSGGYWAPSARRFRARLAATFDEVVPTRTTWRNLPPAMTYVCRRPIR